MRLVCPPPEGFWRVSAWSQPFDPPPPPPPIGLTGIEDDDSGRWDDPAGQFRTLYCATQPEGAIGEKIAAFGLNPAVVAKVETFLESEPDDEFADDSLSIGLTADEISAFGWRLGHAPRTTEADVLIDVENWRTFRALAQPMIGAFARFALGLRSFDRHSLLAEQRRVTRVMAGVYRQAATDTDGDLRLFGLRFRSRLPPAWECWALWEPLPLDKAQADSVPLTIEHPHLRAAAAQLGVVLWEMAL
jgi:hypothetical protein